MVGGWWAICSLRDSVAHEARYFTRPRYRQAYRLAAVAVVATACGFTGGFTGTLANAQSDDLISAAERGDLPAVNALLTSRADVNVRKYSRTAR
jgi:hypothetical protein